MHPAFMGTFLAGLKLGFERFANEGGDVRIQWVVRETGLSSGELFQSAKKMVEDDRVDLTLTLANPAIVPRLIPVFETNGTCLLVCDAGANLVRPSERSPHVFHNTLGYWQSCYAMGQRAVREHGPKIFILTSVYETGYDALEAFRLGVQRAGGQEVGLAILDAHNSNNDLVKTLALLEDLRPDAVYLAQSGPDAQSILVRSNLYGLLKLAPVVGSPFLAEGGLDGEAASAAVGIKSGMSWAHGLGNPENQAFLSSYASKMGVTPDAIGLLGYDTANLVIAALSTAESRRDLIPAALESARWTGPRGEMTMNAQTHTTKMPLYLRQTRKAQGAVQVVDTGTLPSVDEGSAEIQSLMQKPRTGWDNAYLGA
ncbi:MAG: ABC transporter substrate-binding protein [Holophagaceae bacterium]|nr:ABC transporter substrate-binding protein [Holophagaceae bacterium]